MHEVGAILGLSRDHVQQKAMKVEEAFTTGVNAPPMAHLPPRRGRFVRASREQHRNFGEKRYASVSPSLHVQGHASPTGSTLDKRFRLPDIRKSSIEVAT